MQFRAPLETQAAKLPFSIQGAFPITQIPGQIGETVRQVGRFAGLQPQPLDIAVNLGPALAGIRINNARAEQAVNLLRNRLTPSDVDTIGRFAEVVETGGGKRNLGELGQTIHSLAKNVFGKDAVNWSNEKIKNAFDLVLGKIGQSPNLAGLGLEARPIRSITKTAERLGRKLSQQVEQVSTQAPTGEALKGIGKQISRGVPPPVKEKTRISFDAFYQNFLDRFHPVTKLREIAIKAGAKLRPGQDPLFRARAYLGVQGKAETQLFHKTYRITPEGNVEWTGEGLKPILEPVKGTIDDFENYLVARRVGELVKRDIETGIDPQAARRAVAEAQTKYGPVFEETAQKVTAYAHRLLDQLVENGRMAPDLANKIKASNQFYVPFQRAMDVMEEFGHIPQTRNVFNRIFSPIYKIKGSERKIISPLESLIKGTYQITNAAERNAVAQSIVRLRSISPELEQLIVPTKPKMFAATTAGGEAAFRPGQVQEPGVIEVFENGARHFYRVPDELYKMMTGLNEEMANVLTRILAYPAKVLRAGATQLNPEFAVPNVVRDQWSAFFNAKYGFVPGWDFVKGLFSAIGKGDLYYRWQASGGAQSMLVSLDRVANRATLQQLLGKRQVTPTKPLDLLQAISELSEKPTRISVFERARQKVSDVEAAFQSREATVDFARRGAKMKALNMIYAFFNARLQGIEKVGRTIRENPVRAGLMGAPFALISVFTYLSQRNDPEYQEIPQWQKDFFWVFKVKGKWLRVPKGDIGLLFGTPTEHVLAFLEKQDSQTFATLAKSVFGGVSPISDIGGILSTAFRPPLEVAVNYDLFRKQPIVPRSKQEKLPAEQYTPYTSELFKKVGEVLNVSPAKAEHLFTGFTAGLGRMGVDVADLVLFGRQLSEMPKDITQRPILRRFFVREPIGSASMSVDKFYDEYQKITQAATSARDAFKSGDQKAFQLIIGKYGYGVIGIKREFDKIAQTLSDYRSEEQKIRQDTSLSGEEKKQKVQSLQRQATDLTKRFLSDGASSKKEYAYTVRGEKLQVIEMPQDRESATPNQLDEIKKHIVDLATSGRTDEAVSLMRKYTIRLEIGELTKRQDQIAEKAASLVIEDKQNEAVQLMKQYNVRLEEGAIEKAAKSKIKELYKAGLTNEAVAIMRKFQIRLEPGDLD